MLRTKTKIGDVFAVTLDPNTKKYFQYVANDLTQLNSDVIRAFKKGYQIDDNPELRDVVADDVDFCAHVVIKWGIKKNLWIRVGNVPFTGKLDALFRDTNDYGNKFIKVSNRWYVWRINEEFQDVGRLTEDYQKADIGIVVSPNNIVERMRIGKYTFVYPGY